MFCEKHVMLMEEYIVFGRSSDQLGELQTNMNVGKRMIKQKVDNQ